MWSSHFRLLNELCFKKGKWQTRKSQNTGVKDWKTLYAIMKCLRPSKSNTKSSMSSLYIHIYLRGISKLNPLLVGRTPIKTTQMYIFVCFRVNLFPTSSLGWPESSCNSSIFYFYFILWSCFKKLIGLESMYICNILIHITGFMSTFHFNYN